MLSIVKTRCLPALLVMLLAARAFAGTIPDLKWEQRSDWVNIKTDITPKAVGDGMADDTAALQAALDAVKPGSVVYLPAGIYRLTKTLDFDRPRPTGVLIIGHGAATIIKWDGPAGARMLWDHGGATDSRYVGLTWDGSGKATIGIDHASKTFETQITHQYEAFLNLTDSGIRIGSREQPAGEKRQETSEVLYDNCLFENCGRGVAFILWNDYDNTFDGCEFRHCGIGIHDRHGNVYARNCHFEGSTEADLSIMSEHGSSVRRCTSIGSKRFIDYRSSVAPLTIQDCRVARWTATDGAITLSGSPVMLFDCGFSSGPGNQPPIKIGSGKQRLIISQNTIEGAVDLLDPKTPGTIYLIPAGKREASLKSAEQRFLKSEVPMPSRIFDVKRDFGAAGDGKADDTAAIAKAIDAARSAGNNAMAYLPTGLYLIKQTIQIIGSDYTVGGTGFSSRILWRGEEHGTMFAVQDPQHVTLEHLNIRSHDVGAMKNDVDIHQTTTGKASSICYDDVHLYGKYDKQPNVKGLRATNLSSNCFVHLRLIEGNLHFTDSSSATILADVSYEGSITVDGKDKRRDGFVGIQSRLATITPSALYIRDNHSFTASDFYIEQADDGISIEGSAGDPEGRIVIQGAKMHTKQGPVTINGYSGQIFLGHHQYVGEPKPAVVAVQSTRPLEFFLLNNTFYNTWLDLRPTGTSKVYLIGNIGIGETQGHTPADASTPETLAKVSAALDDLRRLGEEDLKANHPEVLK